MTNKDLLWLIYGIGTPIAIIAGAYLTVWLQSIDDPITMNGKPNPKYKPVRFLSKVAEVKKAFPTDTDFPTVLASSTYPSLKSTRSHMFKTLLKSIFRWPLPIPQRLSPINQKSKRQSTIRNVEEFHRVFGGPIGKTKEVPDGPHTAALMTAYHTMMSTRHYLRHYAKEDVRCQRVALGLEEEAEKCKAFADRDVKAVFDACIDVGYINAGDAIVCGLHEVYEEGDARVHQSNMSKIGLDGKAILDPTGKIIKGPNYKPVILDDLVKNK